MGVEIVEGVGTVLGVNVGHPIVTNGDCGVVILCVKGGDADLPKFLWNFLFSLGLRGLRNPSFVGSYSVAV